VSSCLKISASTYYAFRAYVGNTVTIKHGTLNKFINQVTLWISVWMNRLPSKRSVKWSSTLPKTTQFCTFLIHNPIKSLCELRKDIVWSLVSRNGGTAEKETLRKVIDFKRENDSLKWGSVLQWGKGEKGPISPLKGAAARTAKAIGKNERTYKMCRT
jgi:hypothetical protein